MTKKIIIELTIEEIDNIVISLYNHLIDLKQIMKDYPLNIDIIFLYIKCHSMFIKFFNYFKENI